MQISVHTRAWTTKRRTNMRYYRTEEIQRPMEQWSRSTHFLSDSLTKIDAVHCLRHYECASRPVLCCPHNSIFHMLNPTVGSALYDRTGDNNSKLFWIAAGMKKRRRYRMRAVTPGAGLPSMHGLSSIPCFHHSFLLYPHRQCFPSGLYGILTITST
ncbi:hypothetical protein M011DRAFT_149295 [Sporormia fimetaria CBS 119925]|uniref:Uncharacterized protein n=1 Tax=Sporormia fimetaria CBS 119925 TaxID=1340428 RepID=A0A6A6V3F3_9PLEO|nr:hypothetical protein M011DRAFT_149295 [Sporormia fimetaria CBS 119925]